MTMNTNPNMPAIAPPRFRPRRARGIALPVVLIILAAMLVSGVYLLKTVHSTSLTTGNLAYDETLSRAADFGLLQGYDWLRATAATGKVTLDSNQAAQGYVAFLNTRLTPRDADFWSGSLTARDADDTPIEYVIHRLCKYDGAFSATNNECLLTLPNTATLGKTVPLGASLSSRTPAYKPMPQLHYVITARVAGRRGGGAVNQMIVLIGV